MKIERGITSLAQVGGFGYKLVTKTLVFAGATGDGVGDFNGTGDPAVLFTVTGNVIVKVIAVCLVNMVHEANSALEVGIAATQDAIIATTDLTANAMAAGEIWHDAVPDSEIEALSVIKEFIISDGNDIKMDTTVANANTGTIEFYCFWTPLSSDGNVVAA